MILSLSIDTTDDFYMQKLKVSIELNQRFYEINS